MKGEMEGLSLRILILLILKVDKKNVLLLNIVQKVKNMVLNLTNKVSY